MFSPVPRLFLFQVIYFLGLFGHASFFGGGGIPFLFHSGWLSSMPVIYPSDRFDRAFFVFAKLRNHQIIFFFSPSTNAERGIFVRRRRSPASVREQCDAIATSLSSSSSFVDLSFMQRDCFDTHFQPTSIFSWGVFRDRHVEGVELNRDLYGCIAALWAHNNKWEEEEEEEMRRRKRDEKQEGDDKKKKGDHGFSPGPGGLCCRMRGESWKRIRSKRGFFSLSPVCVLVGCNMLSLIGFEKKRKRVELPFHIIWDSRRPYAGTDVRGGEKTSRMCVCVCRRGWKGCCCCCPAHPSRRAEISAAVEAATIDACL